MKNKFNVIVIGSDTEKKSSKKYLSEEIIKAYKSVLIKNKQLFKEK
ncbi:MAG: hypothetical protein IJ736_15130 [Firmicutes bacterium]|nr:hypothetical protein [Bacillota bacterium]